MIEIILLAAASLITLGCGPFTVWYWIPKWEKVGVKKALDRKAWEARQ